MPFVKFLRPTLVGARVLAAGAIVEFDRLRAEAIVKSGAAEYVPAPAPDPGPEHETADNRPASERAAKRVK